MEFVFCLSSLSQNWTRVRIAINFHSINTQSWSLSGWPADEKEILLNSVEYKSWCVAHRCSRLTLSESSLFEEIAPSPNVYFWLANIYCIQVACRSSSAPSQSFSEILSSDRSWIRLLLFGIPHTNNDEIVCLAARHEYPLDTTLSGESTRNHQLEIFHRWKQTR